MTVWQFLRPALPKEYVQKIERLSQNYSTKGRLIAAQTKTRLEQSDEILAILCSGNVAVPIDESYGQMRMQAVLNSLGEEIYDDLAFVVFTSGTTGRPKGVMLTHENIIANLRAIDGYFLLTPSDRLIIARPLVHIAVLVGELLFGLYKNAHIVFYEESFVPQRLAAQLKKEGATAFCCTPTMFYHLSRYIRGSGIKKIVLSGERLNDRIVEIARQTFVGTDFYHVYGLTEHSPRAFALLPEEFLMKAPSIGRPIEGVTAELIDGELCLSSASVMKGYFHDEVLTQNKLKGGLLHTGDMASKDDKGYYTILGRKDEMMIRGGVNVYPQEIENVVLQIPKIKSCKVYSEEDCFYGQKICLLVCGKIKKETLAKQLLKRLPEYLMPNRIEMVNSLQLTASGKIVR